MDQYRYCLFTLYKRVHKEVNTIDQFKKLIDQGQLIGN